MSADIHQSAAEEVWSAFSDELRSLMNREDFIIGFKLGRASMAACFAGAELLHANDPVPDKPFTPEPTTKNQQTT